MGAQLAFEFGMNLRAADPADVGRQVRLVDWLASRPVQEHICDRALSIRQPWLRLLQLGLKTWEFRSKPNGRLGWTICLHTSKALDANWRGILRAAGAPSEWPGEQSAICAVATLGRCVPLGPRSRDRDVAAVPLHHPGRPSGTWSGFAWELLELRPVQPAIECQGQLGLWVVPEQLQEEVLRRVVA